MTTLTHPADQALHVAVLRAEADAPDEGEYIAVPFSRKTDTGPDARSLASVLPATDGVPRRAWARRRSGGRRNESLRLWLMTENRLARSSDYPPRRRELLEAQGYVFTAPTVNARLWQLRIAQLQSYIEYHGTWRVRHDEPQLRAWLYASRKSAREGLLEPHLVNDLEALGVSVALLPNKAKNGHGGAQSP
jgi:hypothetical protein